MTNLKETAENALEMGKQVKDTVAAFGETAANKVAEVRDGAGRALHNVAGSIRQGSDAIDHAAEKFDSAGSFVESCQVKNAVAKAGEFGRSHMTGSLLIAMAVGFLVGAAMFRATGSSSQA